MSATTLRRVLVRTLVQFVRSDDLCGGAARPLEERVAVALAALVVRASALGAKLEACVSADGCLVVAVEVPSWSVEVEAALRRAVTRHESLLAPLVLADWFNVRLACGIASMRRTVATYRHMPV